MIDGRKRLAGALTTLCIAALGGAVLVASPSSADPSIDDVQAQVDRLYHEAEQASERYNDARLELDEARNKLDGPQQGARSSARRRRDGTSETWPRAVVAQYQGQALTTAAQVMLADDPQEFLSQLTTVSEHNSQQAYMVESLAVEVERLELREELAQQEIDAIERTEATLAEEKQRHRREGGRSRRRCWSASRPSERDAEVRASRSTPRATAPTQHSPPRRPAAQPPQSSTPWPRSATPTSGAPPAPTPTTARGSPRLRGRRQASRCRTRPPRRWAAAPGCPPATCDPATWSSTTAR